MTGSTNKNESDFHPIINSPKRVAAGLIFFLVVIAAFPSRAISESLPLLKMRFDSKKQAESKATSRPVEGEEGAPVLTKTAITSRGDIQLKFERNTTVPGERWLCGKIEARCKGGSQVRASLFDVGPNVQLGTIQSNAAESGRIWVNLRDAPSDESCLRVELLEGGKVVSAKQVLLSRENGPTLPVGTKIPIRINTAKEFQPASSPITFGVAFAAGQLWNIDGIRIVDSQSKPAAAQLEAVATWYPQGSIKWLRIDTVAVRGRDLFVEYAPGTPSASCVSPVQVRRKDAMNIEVQVGRLRYDISANLSPVRGIIRDGKEVAGAEGSRGLFVVDQKGRVASVSDKGAKVDIEASGPLAACIRIEGPYLTKEGEELARHITRVEFASGEERARVTHSFILSRSTKEIWFREIGWDFQVKPGNGEQAIFATSANNWKSAHSIPLKNGESAYMVQDQHYQYFHGTNHFEVVRVGSLKSEKLSSGEECGDWSALQGSDGGLLMACRNTAQTHPKEFTVTPNRLSLLLYSPRAGEELDFTLQSRVRTIDLKNLLVKASYKGRNIDETVAGFLKNPNDALGWSKTHELVIAPIEPSAKSPDQFAQAAAALSFPVYAMTDPAWLCSSGALGLLHPYDPQRFGAVEKCVEDYVEAMRTFGERFGEFGILDYQAGPHFVKSIEGSIPYLRRWMASYNFRQDLWYLYARRGQRSVREFAQGSNRFYLDSYMTHASDGKGKIAGFYCAAMGSDDDESIGRDPHNLPVQWGMISIPQADTTADLGKFTLDYYLTGYRRGKDAAIEFGEAAKAFATPQKMAKLGRVLRFLYNIVQAYSVTWDEELETIANQELDVIYDPDAALGLYVDKLRSTSYKTSSDFNALVYTYTVLRQPRIKDMALKIADLWRDNYGVQVFTRELDTDMGAFLYEEGDRSMIGECMALKLRQLPPEKPIYVPASSAFVMRGFAVAQKIAIDSGAWNKPVASFSGIETIDCNVTWLFQHEIGINDLFRYSWTHGESRQSAGKNVRLAPLEDKGLSGFDTLSLTLAAHGKGVFRIPKDIKTGVYKIEVNEPGTHFLVADKKLPLVAYLPGFWRPVPAQNPAYPIFFKVPAGSTNAELFLEKEGTLVAPDGQAWNGGKPVKEWIKLPGSDKGPWKLLLPQPGLITGRGFPPYYAFGDPSIFFLPSGRQIPPPEPVKIQPALNFSGVVQVGEKETLLLPLPKNITGRKALPQGTVEFYICPKVEATDISSLSVNFLKVNAQEGDPITFSFSNGNATRPYQFELRTPVQLQRAIGFRTSRKFLFRKNHWYHVAFSWGNSGKDTSGNVSFLAKIFIDGQYGLGKPDMGMSYHDYVSKIVPTELVIGPGIPCEVAAVRVSDIERYTSDFQPPSPEQLAKPDNETLAIFDFKSGSREPKAGTSK